MRIEEAMHSVTSGGKRTNQFNLNQLNMSPNATGTRFYNPNNVEEGSDGQSRFLMNL